MNDIARPFPLLGAQPLMLEQKFFDRPLTAHEKWQQHRAAQQRHSKRWGSAAARITRIQHENEMRQEQGRTPIALIIPGKEIADRLGPKPRKENSVFETRYVIPSEKQVEYPIAIERRSKHSEQVVVPRVGSKKLALV